MNADRLHRATPTGVLAGTTLDRTRLMVAAHELGHAVVWSVTGMPVEDIHVAGRGTSTSGYAQLANQARFACEADCRSYLVGILAGGVAEDRWCRDTSTRPVDGCSADRRMFRRGMRERRDWGVTDSRAELLAQARHLVRVHWTTIVRLTPRLAHRGRLPLTDLPRGQRR